MPTDYRLIQIAAFQTKFQDKSPSILSYIKSSPGEDVSSISSGTGESITDTEMVLHVLEISQIIVAATGIDDGLRYWHSEDWANSLSSSLGQARTWQSNHNGGLMSEMATDLSIPYEIAERLGWILEYEGTSKRANV